MFPGGTAAIRPKLKEIVTTAEGAGFYSLWVMDHYYQIKGLFGESYTDPMMEAYTEMMQAKTDQMQAPEAEPQDG